MWLLSFALAASGPHALHEAQYGQKDHWKLPVLPMVPLPPAAQSSTQAIVYGYHPYWGDDPTKLDFDRLTHVAIFEVGLNSDGSLSYTSRWTDVAGSVVPLAHAKGCKVDLCVVSFDSGVQSSVLGSASRRATAIANLKELVDRYGADGVNVDIEGLSGSLREELVTFTQELDAAVGEVWVASPAVDWSDAFDKQALSKLSGGMFIMGYDYHWPGGDPGPNAPLYGGGIWSSYSLEKTVQTYLSEGADPQKIVLGLPLYGQEWPVASQSVPTTATGDGWSVLMDEAAGIGTAEGKLYDSGSHTPYVKRTGEGTQLWYDDNDSVQERIHFAIAQGLGGVGFWALTYEGNNPKFWDMVEAETTLTPPDTGDTGTTDDTGTSDDTGKPVAGVPIARAGQTIHAQAGDTVILNGRGSEDPDGYPLAYTWTQLSGPVVVELQNADQAQPSFVVPQGGSYSFQLVVNTKHGTSTPDSVMVIAGESGGFCGIGPAAAWGWALIGMFAALRRR